MKITGRKSAYDVGDVVVVYLSGREIKSTVVKVLTNYIDFMPLGYDYTVENDEFGKVSISHYDILGLAETTDNEPKDNEGWIMVDSELPDTNKPIFFVFETGIMLIGYFSEVSGNFIAYTVPNLYLAYQPKQVIKWQYVKFPKI